MHKLTKPCKECPFRKASVPGWLGPWEPDELMSNIPYVEFPCHKTIKPSDKGVAPHHQVCAGAAMFLNNKVQRSRAPIMDAHQSYLRDQAVDHSGVFSNAQEFMAHHTQDRKIWAGQQTPQLAPNSTGHDEPDPPAPEPSAGRMP